MCGLFYVNDIAFRSDSGSWDPRGDHVFIAEQVDGQTRFIDPQPGREDVSWYFSQIKPEETCLIKVDNLKFDAKVNKCAKPR